jgi:hypothetical protein
MRIAGFPVIPNRAHGRVRNPQLGIRREGVADSRRFLVVSLLGMTGGLAPRNDISSLVIPNHAHGGVRNLQLGIKREGMAGSRRFLVVSLLGMTGGWRLGMTGGLTRLGMTERGAYRHDRVAGAPRGSGVGGQRPAVTRAASKTPRRLPSGPSTPSFQAGARPKSVLPVF